MTEAEWLACNDPNPMAEGLRGRVSERKARFFFCACCRRIWDLLPDERCRAGIEAVERYADGEVDDASLLVARQGAHEAFLHWKGEEYSAEAEANFCDTADYSAVCA